MFTRWFLGRDDDVQACGEINLRGTVRPWLFSSDRKAMAKIEAQENGDADVCCEKASRTPLALQEDPESVQQQQERKHRATDP